MASESVTFLLSTMFDQLELEGTENKLSTMVLMRSLAHTDHVFLVFFLLQAVCLVMSMYACTFLSSKIQKIRIYMINARANYTLSFNKNILQNIEAKKRTKIKNILRAQRLSWIQPKKEITPISKNRSLLLVQSVSGDEGYPGRGHHMCIEATSCKVVISLSVPSYKLSTILEKQFQIKLFR